MATKREISKVKNLKVPRAPKDLWRKMLAQIEEAPESFQMNCWHMNPDARPLEEYPETLPEKRCCTVHCQAGWVTFLTKGGLELESDLKRRRVEHKTWDQMEAEGYSEYVRAGSDDVVPAAALLILEKSGWGNEVQQRHFHRSHGEALRHIEYLAEKEAKREKAVARQKKRALTKEKRA